MMMATVTAATEAVAAATKGVTATAKGVATAAANVRHATKGARATKGGSAMAGEAVAKRRRTEAAEVVVAEVTKVAEVCVGKRGAVQATERGVIPQRG